jgi:CheY-like chemotaxis protein
MSKTALIVDDSPVARHALGRLLAEHELAADTAPSAEAALDYLRQRRPDVIFMDHMMPGMDGFEALEAIKANPATATIPVMMYTSQEGELYVGQARALGAFGVLPKDLKPVEVARVLKALRLIPGPPEPDPTVRSAAKSATEAADSHRVKELLEELFYQQRSALREEIREGYQRALATTQAPPEAGAAISSLPPKLLGVSGLGAGALALVAVTFAYLYFNANRLLQDATERSSQLIASSAELNAASAQVLGAQAVPAPGNASLLNAVEWAMNLAGGYSFDEVPLDDNRAQMIGRLVQYLDDAGFSGTIAIEVHVGRFCMNFDADGMPVLAPPNQPAGDCVQIGWSPVEATAMGRQQTLAFANTVATATTDTGIRVATVSAGSDRPTIEYPLLNAYLTAAEWNEIAAANHRIDMRLVPDADSYFSSSEGGSLVPP